MARISDTHDMDLERGTGSFLMPESGDKDTSTDVSTGGSSEKSGLTDQSSLDPEQHKKPLIINGGKSHINITDNMNGNKLNRTNSTTTKAKKKRKLRPIGVVSKLFCCLGLVTFIAGVVLIVLAVFIIDNKKCDATKAKSSAIVGESTPSAKDNMGSWVASSQKPGGLEGGVDNSNEVEDEMISFTLAATVPSTTPSPIFEHLVNLASKGEAFQSSTYQDRLSGVTYFPSAAIDGKDARTLKSGSCSQTTAEKTPVWWIDLGALKLVKRVRILQPSDCCGGSLSNFEVRVGQQQDLAMNVLCRDYMGAALSPLVDIECQRQIYGRYVSIQLLNQNNRKRRLTLCEVSIYDR